MLKKLKALERGMGLGESEEESSGSESVSHKKRKRENMELMQERKKWKGQGGQETRLCNLYLMGKCPRVSPCLFFHYKVVCLINLKFT